MSKFEPIPIEESNKPKQEVGVASDSAVQKAKDAADIQKYETQRIEAQQKAVFAENSIKDVEDLQNLLLAVKEKENKLARDFMEFDNRKATELSEAQKLKAEHERRLAELVKREQDLATRTRNVELREKLVQEREDLMTSVEQQNLEETEKHNSLVERLRRSFPRISALMGDNANILDRAGFRNFADDLFDDIEQMERWHKNDIGSHCDTIVEWMKGEVEDCNKKAVAMSRSPEAYNQSDWDSVVDNLEEIYGLLPELKPANLPSDD